MVSDWVSLDSVIIGPASKRKKNQVTSGVSLLSYHMLPKVSVGMS